MFSASFYSLRINDRLLLFLFWFRFGFCFIASFYLEVVPAFSDCYIVLVSFNFQFKFLPLVMFGLFLVFWFLIRALFISFRFLFSLQFLFRFLQYFDFYYGFNWFRFLINSVWF